MPPHQLQFLLAVAFTVVATAAPKLTSAACIGDCDVDGTVTVDELITGVSIAIGTVDPSACIAMDADGDGAVTVDELVRAVNVVLGNIDEDPFPFPPTQFESS